MERHRIIAHFFMWGMILSGVLLSFLLFPSLLMFQSFKYYTIYIAVIFLVYLAYHFISLVYYRITISKNLLSMNKAIRKGIYGRIAHPTCLSILILSWAFFLIYPDVRVFASDLWMTAVIFFWIKIEENGFIIKRKEKSNSIEMEVG
jgi:hypothetical protein